MKVLHLPDPVGGMPWSIAQGEKSLGLDSRVLVRASSWLGYKADYDVRMNEATNKVAMFARLMKSFLQIRNQYDIFHFNFGSSLIHIPKYGFNQFELPFYPKKSPLFVTYNGCDARQKFKTMKRTAIAACHNPECYDGQCNSGKLDEYRDSGIKKMSRYVTHMWAVNPDLLHFLPPEKSSFLPYAIEPRDVVSPDFRKQKLRVVHAPTNRAAKGSLYILDALKRLERERPSEIEVILVEKVPHAEALRMYQSADLVIDQVLIGWYGGFAVETMYMGKPVIARIAEEDLKFIPSKMADDVRKTVINADPETLYSVLNRLLNDRSELENRSSASIEYAHRWHLPAEIAKVTKAAYERALTKT